MQILSRVSDVKGIKSFKWFAYDHIHNEVYPGWISNGDTIVMRIIKDKTKELRDYLTKGRDIQDRFGQDLSVGSYHDHFLQNIVIE